jgi:transposase InsO family protein
MDSLTPKDHAEAVALFRAELIGSLTCRELVRGELAEELRTLAEKRFRPPGWDHTRTYTFPTLERWYYAFREGGLSALRPQPRSDRGHGRALTPKEQALILDIRREHPSASAPLILRTLMADGRLADDAVQPVTLNRLFHAHGLDRRAARDGSGGHTRLRWQAERPGALWHGDVCHAGSLRIGGLRRPLRIHGLLDDASRYVPALEAHHQERELDMLGVWVRSLRKHPAPGSLYLDNGSTYRGDILRVACARLGVTLLHARPYDAPARGKMERFWRTLREGCLDHLGQVASLHDVNVRLWAFLDQHYHRAPHASLMGKSPQTVFTQNPQPADALEERDLREALTVRESRRVRRDTTVSVSGTDWELEQGFLAGRKVTLAYCLVDPQEAPWVEYEGKSYPLHRVDPLANSRKKRPPRRKAPPTDPNQPKPDFDPPGALLDLASGRRPAKKEPR